MVSKYNEFLLEKSLNLINESKVVYMENFRNLLTKIDSPVSKILLDVENKDIDIPTNFFDISDNKDSISFIPDKRAQDILNDKKLVTFISSSGASLTHNMIANGEIFKDLGFSPNGEQHYQPSDGELGEVISKTVSKLTGKTYLYMKFQNGECVINENYIRYGGSISHLKKQSIRTGRGIRSILNAVGQKVTDSEIEQFVNKYKAAFDRMNDVFSNFHLVSGEEIAFWYKRNNYSRGCHGTLGNSCMATVPSRFLDIYTKNPEVCSLLILKSDSDDTKIKGRSLIWKANTSVNSDGIIFMDRIYCHSDSDIQLFRDYSKYKQWNYKKDNDSSAEAYAVSPSGECINYDVLSVPLKQKSYDSYPYVDTIKYLTATESGSFLTTDGSDGYCLEDTDGGNGERCDMCDGEGRVSCRNCDGGEEDCSSCDSGKIDCQNTYCEDGKIECKYCDGNKEIDGAKCEDCDGRGSNDCGLCKGEGEIECEECDGSGTIDCGDCYGNGDVDCPECN